MFLGLAVLLVITYEIRTSALQSWLFSHLSKQLTYSVAPGPSSRIVFPREGPFNQRFGYTSLPEFQRRLESASFEVTAQSRFSPGLARLTGWGISPPYREPSTAGLVIRSAQGGTIYSSAESDLQFHSLDEVPSIVVSALLAIENRELADPSDVRRNPVVEWDRLAKAGLTYAGSKIGLPFRVEGGSTLATQIEKYRYSAGGRTESPVDKLNQILAATLKVYRNGVDTRPQRNEIVLEYLNTMPLSASQGFGEVHGLGQGLLAWYGLRLEDMRRNLAESAPLPERAKALKHVMSLLASVRAPSSFLLHDRRALEARANFYVRQLADQGVITADLAATAETVPLNFITAAAVSLKTPTPEQKTANVIRNNLSRLIAVPSFYDLDRLHVTVDSTIDRDLQEGILNVFRSLKDPAFLAANGFRGERLLAQGDPSEVLYSLLLFERTPQGNALRVQLDSLDRFFDINDGMKLELGSTAKLRTLSHYMEIITLLYGEFSPLNATERAREAAVAGDPITLWAAATLSESEALSLETFLEKALNRKYSGNPGELFFTGGGAHVFHNFDKNDNGRMLTVREATQRSTNLVYIRLMRDLVRFHQARLPYDSKAVLNNPADPVRIRMLSQIADSEGKHFLYRAFADYRNQPSVEVVSRLLGRRSNDPRRLAVLFYAFQHGSGTPADGPALAAWIDRFGSAVSEKQIPRLIKAYGSRNLTLSDYAYLADVHPLNLWCAGEMISNPGLSWSEVQRRSSAAQTASAEWLFKTRNRRAQDLRLRIRVEQDAFERMTPYWRRLGFPFERLVPSLATALGNSSDRPSALAELMGVIANDGLNKPTVRMTSLHFATGTPYETNLSPRAAEGQRVMAAPAARLLRQVLSEVVERGTARRLAGAFVLPDGTHVTSGGKTGSGDNEYKSFARGGGVISARAVNRTATFVFYIGDRYYGVLTAFVDGPQAAHYSFTSALPVSIVKLLAPELNRRLARS